MTATDDMTSVDQGVGTSESAFGPCVDSPAERRAVDATWVGNYRLTTTVSLFTRPASVAASAVASCQTSPDCLIARAM